MVAGMAPCLRNGEVVFCTTRDAETVAAALPHASAVVREAEGVTLVLPVGRARELGFDAGLPMRQITLTVQSALDAVGLTAAVAAALAEDDIPCNVIAGYHHDHVFVPAGRADDAVIALRRIARAASGG